VDNLQHPKEEYKIIVCTILTQLNSRLSKPYWMK